MPGNSASPSPSPGGSESYFPGPGDAWETVAPGDVRWNKGRLDDALAYALERRQFGQPIASFQMIQSKLADMYVWVESMRVFTYQALRAANHLEIGGGGRGEIHKITAASVLFTANTMSSTAHTVSTPAAMPSAWASTHGP